MVTRILCVAEKSSVAKAVATHLSGGRFRTRDTGYTYTKNYDFDYTFNGWGSCSVTMTAVSGHTEELDFEPQYRKWTACDPQELFDLPVAKYVSDEKKPIAKNIEKEARHAQTLFIWTDCDREGEYIGTEVRNFAQRGNPRIGVKRAKFSNIEREHIIRAAQNPINLDERQASAVSARIEMDLRIGAAFTRYQTMFLQRSCAALKDNGLMSYGTCQFPTMGFVVDRYQRVKSFVSEPFWSIKVMHRKEDINVTFTWDRNRLFDRLSVVLLFESCFQAKHARVVSVIRKPTSKWKPLPLTTVELQKQGSRFLGMNSQAVMKAAETLYQKGFISYPRTETDQFDAAIDLRALVAKQTNNQDNSWPWANYAQSMLDGGFNNPRRGRNNDKAHPPIHPVAWVAKSALGDVDQRKVYEFVTRRFLGCCSDDAKGETTTVNLQFGDEGFHTAGLVVLQRNYLDIYVYDKWTSSQTLPRFEPGEEFVPNEANMIEGHTSAPNYLTEPELIGLMDANGIGTDATMAEHIEKVQTRQYVFAKTGNGHIQAPGGGGGRGRGAARGGRGRGRDGRAGGYAEPEAPARPGGNATTYFVPSNLGMALVEAYDTIAAEMSLSKPFLRQEMEVKMKKICDGELERASVVRYSIEQYREVYERIRLSSNILKQVCQKYLGE